MHTKYSSVAATTTEKQTNQHTKIQKHSSLRPTTRARTDYTYGTNIRRPKNRRPNHTNPHIGVEYAELPVEHDMAEYLDSDPDIEKPNDDPTSRLGFEGSGGGSGSPSCPGSPGVRGASPICREAPEL